MSTDATLGAYVTGIYQSQLHGHPRRLALVPWIWKISLVDRGRAASCAWRKFSYLFLMFAETVRILKHALAQTDHTRYVVGEPGI